MPAFEMAPKESHLLGVTLLCSPLPHSIRAALCDPQNMAQVLACDL